MRNKREGLRIGGNEWKYATRIGRRLPIGPVHQTGTLGWMGATGGGVGPESTGGIG